MKGTILVLSLVAVFLVAGATTAVAEDAAKTITVVVGAGGCVGSDNGAVQVCIPPNAATDSFKLRYLANTGSSFSVRPANAILLPNAFGLDFVDLSPESDHIGSLIAPGTAVVRYNPADLGGRSESTLRMMRLQDDGVTWMEIPSTVDTAARTVTGQFSWPGSYAVAASNVAPTPTPAPTAPPAPAPVPTASPAPTPAPAPAAPPAFRLGFATLASLIPDVVGVPLEDEHYAANGDSLQRTTTGLMVWRKADNWTAFTNGHTTWINGPLGLQSRLNTERFDWEG